MADPVHYDEKTGGWFFYDETWSERHGPFETQAGAQEECSRYAKWLDNHGGLEAEEG